jgi:predicted nucleotidyltransferase
VGDVRDVVFEHAVEIRSLLARRNAVDIRIFGSVARGEDSEGSDVDFLVEFGPEASILDQVHLELDLGALLDCEVDVVALGGLKARDAHLLAEAIAL